jgi:membrane-associated protease RseP (regulator of RpoE activity)
MDPLEVLVIILAVWVIVYLLGQRLPLKKYGVEVNPLYIMYRTKRLNKFLGKTARVNQRFWRIFANTGIAVSIIEMVLAAYFLIQNLHRFLYVPQEAEPIVPLLPGITVSLRWFPYILIAIGLALTIHELSHGVIAFLERIPVKSSGIVVAPITFGGFVEPDEEAFNKSPLVSKLRIISAGSLSNMVAGLLAILLTFALFTPSSGVLIMAVQDGGPAYRAGIRPWDVIYGINGSRVSNLLELALFMYKVGPETPLVIETSNGIRNVVTTASAENASRGIIGVRELISYNSMRVGEINTQFSYHLYTTLSWISLLMVNLAIFNMMPLFPLDGDNFIHSFLKERMKRGVKEARILLNSIFLALIVLNIGFSFIRYGLTPI